VCLCVFVFVRVFVCVFACVCVRLHTHVSSSIQHSTVWTGDPLASLDLHMLPLAGTRARSSPSHVLSRDNLQSSAVGVADAAAGGAGGEFASAATAAADAAVGWEGVRDELADVPFHSPWALGGTNRCGIHIIKLIFWIHILPLNTSV